MLRITTSWNDAAQALVCAACVVMLGSAGAQTAPDPAAVQRGLERELDSLKSLTPTAKPPTREIFPPPEPEAAISKLVGVQVQVPDALVGVSADIEAYWLRHFRKPVSSEEIATFKAWLWQGLQQKGYLGYAQLTYKPEADGTMLILSVKAPTIGRATVLTLDAKEVDEYAHLVAKRFGQAYPDGSFVDIQGIEAQLKSIAYDIPVELEAILRQTGTELVDVVINLKRVGAKPGQVTSALVQLNNHGLVPYGREQLLGVARVAGSRPLSEFVGVAQFSQGVRYVRGEYSQPLAGWASRWNVYGTAVQSEAQLSQEGIRFVQDGRSTEMGAGLTTLQSTSRTGSWFSLAEASQRNSKSDLTINSTGARVPTRDRRDQQLRLAMQSIHTPGWVDRLNSETTLTLGNLRLNAGDSTFGQDDAGDLQGAYTRIEHTGSLQTALSDPSWTFTSRWRAQLASKNMDANNQIALGGPTGIRAFESDEGVGDEGVQVSLDLTRQFNDHLYAGVFYDAGQVRVSKKSAGNTYVLQGAGVLLGGKFSTEWDWSLSTATSFGSTPLRGINNEIGDWRSFFSANWRY
jgi:hemolysin activation/secretion protein